MTDLIDARGCAISGATPAALEHHELALRTHLAWRRGTADPLARALQEAPSFTMAHVLQAYATLTSRDPRRVRAAAKPLARAAALPANERERLHIAAIGAVLGDDYERSKQLFGELLRAHPRDVLALHVAHALDHATSDADRMRERIAAVLPAWSPELPGHAVVLAMHAFSLIECGDDARAEDAARTALDADAFDARAHHVMAHVFELSGRPGDGIRWMNEHAPQWSVGTGIVTHGWWHAALFHLERDEVDRALALYDRRMRPAPSDELADLIDAAALLWRLRLREVDVSARFAELADAWSPHIDDAFCSFNDMHAMLAFVGADDTARAQRLEHALVEAQWRPTRHGATTRWLGLPACRALLAFGRGEDHRAIEGLAGLSATAQGLGGSHAQRDVLQLTLLRAVERTRRPRLSWRGLRAGAVRSSPRFTPWSAPHPPNERCEIWD